MRIQRGWRQEDLVAALGNQYARSSLANVETGREAPSARLWALISERLPEWVSDLEHHYLDARAGIGPQRSRSSHRVPSRPGSPIPGAFSVESLQLVCTYRYSHAPEEIIEVRRVKALTSGGRTYGLDQPVRRSDDVTVEVEALWGGSLVPEDLVASDDGATRVRTVDFGRTLRRGQTHDFAVRSWVERDPNPRDEIVFAVQSPTRVVTIHANFAGPHVPRAVWRFGPPGNDPWASAGDGPSLTMSSGAVRLEVNAPIPGSCYGIGWTW